MVLSSQESPALPNANLNGAAEKFGSGSALLLLTDRNKASDIFGSHFSMKDWTYSGERFFI